MDTTFKSVKNPHNVHTVKCSDCHTKGVPKKKARVAQDLIQTVDRQQVSTPAAPILPETR